MTNQNIFIDIETAPLDEDYIRSIAPDFKAPKTYKKEEAIEEYKLGKLAEYIAEGALKAQTGRVIAFGFAIGEHSPCVNIAEKPADEKRILRALEVWLETGKTITQHNEETKQIPPRYDAVWIGLQFEQREDMRALIDLRVDKMVEEGLLREVQQLLASGIPRDATALQAIGYKEFLGVAEGSITAEEAIAEVKLRSRQYAKRQLTWLRKNQNIHWIFWEKQRDFARALQLSTEILTAEGLS